LAVVDRIAVCTMQAKDLVTISFRLLNMLTLGF